MDLDAHNLHSLFLSAALQTHCTCNTPEVHIWSISLALITAHVKSSCTTRFCHASRRMTSSYFKGLTHCLPFAMYVVVTVEAGNKAICLHFVCSPLPSFLSLDSLPSLFPTFTACELVYLGSMDVPGPGSEALLVQAVQQMKSLELSTMNIVTFKASEEGITLTHNVYGYMQIVSNHYFKLWMGW